MDQKSIQELCAMIERKVEAFATEAGFAVIDAPPQHRAPTGEPFITFAVQGVKPEGDVSWDEATPEEAAAMLLEGFFRHYQQAGNVYWRAKPLITLVEATETRHRKAGATVQPIAPRWRARMRVLVSRQPVLEVAA